MTSVKDRATAENLNAAKAEKLWTPPTDVSCNLHRPPQRRGLKSLCCGQDELADGKIVWTPLDSLDVAPVVAEVLASHPVCACFA